MNFKEAVAKRMAWFEAVAARRREREQQRASTEQRDESMARRRDHAYIEQGPRYERAWEKAWDLQRSAVGLRGLATTTLAEVLAPFEDWSVKDVQWALDAMPDGTEHMGGTTMTPEARLVRRLQPWRDLPGPHTEHTQRVLAEQRERHERLYLRRTIERIEREEAVPMPAQVRQELAQLRTARRAARPAVPPPAVPER